MVIHWSYSLSCLVGCLAELRSNIQENNHNINKYYILLLRPMLSAKQHKQK